MISWPVTLERSPCESRKSGCSHVWMRVGAAAAEVPGEQVEQLLEVRVQRRVAALLDAELDPDDHRLGREDHVGGALDVARAARRRARPTRRPASVSSTSRTSAAAGGARGDGSRPPRRRAGG